MKLSRTALRCTWQGPQYEPVYKPSQTGEFLDLARSIPHEVMELCAGGDLDKHMKGQGGPYSEHQA